MSYPQTIAEELAERFPDQKLKMIAKYGCCAFASLWFMGIEDDIESILIVADEMGKGLDQECTVSWYEFFKNVSGREIKVEFRDINKPSDLLKIKGKCIVRYDYNGLGHWVGAENGKVVYNSLKHSNCVEKGKPTKARIITLA